jgi:hypothetical protein
MEVIVVSLLFIIFFVGQRRGRGSPTCKFHSFILTQLARDGSTTVTHLWYIRAKQIDEFAFKIKG